jgi:hypothetical protein
LSKYKDYHTVQKQQEARCYTAYGNSAPLAIS